MVLLLLAGFGACGPSEPARWELNGTLIDLSHGFDGATVYWPTEDGFRLTEDAKGWTEGGYYYAANSFQAAEHGGTHLDAPIHFHEGGWTTDEIPVERLIGPAVRVDVREACARDTDYLVTIEDLQQFEAEHGRIPDGAMVLLHTGFARHWPDRTRYMGTELRGSEGVAALHFPGLHPDAARWLLEERSIHAVGLDTPSIDHGPSTSFQTHRVLSAGNVAVFENVASLDRLPPRDFVILALPMKIQGGSGGPLRIVAMVPDSNR